MKYHWDYPSESIGGNNPYQCCKSCKISAPAINGQLENHSTDCAWRLSIERPSPGLSGEILLNCFNARLKELNQENRIAGDRRDSDWCDEIGEEVDQIEEAIKRITS